MGREKKRTCPPPKQLLVRYKNGRPFVVCSNNVRDDPTSCQFTAKKFGRDRGKGQSKIACIVCSVPVEHVLSIGRAVGKDPDTGKTSEFFSLPIDFSRSAVVCQSTRTRVL